ncbi:MAG: hypothetical protein PHI35_03315 [Victivallaceae bacterium]|nr:hypothetical protein [Victivallaceae bacterium]
MKLLVNSFNAGELGPKLRYRVDIDKFKSGLEMCDGFFVMPYGGVENRPGTRFAAVAYDGSHPVTIRRFQFSRSEFAALEFGENYLRILENNPTVIETPWSGEETKDLRFAQKNDVVWIAHPDHAPYILKRSNSGWSLQKFTLTSQPYCNDNTSSSTMTPSATSGDNVTLTCSANYFSSDMIGAYLRLTHKTLKHSVEKTFTADGNSSPIFIKGAWKITTYGSWIGTLRMERKISGGEWTLFRSWSFNADNNVDESGYEDDYGVSYRMVFSGWTAAPAGTLYECRAALSSDSWTTQGECVITAVNSPTSATCHVVNTAFESTDPTSDWAIGAWNDHEGFPACVHFYSGDRLIFANTKNQPQTIWASQVGDYADFYNDTQADASFTVTVSGSEYSEIRWITELDALIVGSSNGIGVVAPADEANAIGPGNVRYLPKLGCGCANNIPAATGETLLYFRRGNRSLIELAPNEYTGDTYLAPDMTTLAHHILESGAADCCFRMMPYPMLFCVRNDGMLVTFTYNRTENVTAWARHTTQGRFESCCNLATDTGDDRVYFVVNRQNQRFIEYLAPREIDKNACFLDCSSVFDGIQFNVISCPHLAGRTAAVVIDGCDAGNIDVPANGIINLPFAGNRVTVGLRYTSSIKTMPLNLAAEGNSTIGMAKRAESLTVKLHLSAGGEAAGNDGVYRPLEIRRATENFGDPPEVRDRSCRITLSGPRNDDPFVMIRQAAPLPLTLLAFETEYDYV